MADLVKKDNVLAAGEATGHAHVAVSPDAIVEHYSDGTAVLDAPSGTEVVHEEHGPHKLKPGKYDVSQVVEHDPFTAEITKVLD
jgi:hypothetical protein